ncbi:hypothetical protein ACJX0J_018425, partial [Zea mays]
YHKELVMVFIIEESTIEEDDNDLLVGLIYVEQCPRTKYTELEIQDLFIGFRIFFEILFSVGDWHYTR